MEREKGKGGREREYTKALRAPCIVLLIFVGPEPSAVHGDFYAANAQEMFVGLRMFVALRIVALPFWLTKSVTCPYMWVPHIL